MWPMEAYLHWLLCLSTCYISFCLWVFCFLTLGDPCSICTFPGPDLESANSPRRTDPPPVFNNCTWMVLTLSNTQVTLFLSWGVNEVVWLTWFILCLSGRFFCLLWCALYPQHSQEANRTGHWSGRRAAPGRRATEPARACVCVSRPCSSWLGWWHHQHAGRCRTIVHVAQLSNSKSQARGMAAAQLSKAMARDRF